MTLKGVFCSIALIAATTGSTLAADDTSNIVPAGVAEMSSDGVLTMRMYPPVAKEDATQEFRPGDKNYESMLRLVGGIQPGEKKVIPSFIGRADMDARGIITYRFWGEADNGSQLNGVTTLKPGDAEYERLVHVVGGLHPGEWKMVPENKR